MSGLKTITFAALGAAALSVALGIGICCSPQASTLAAPAAQAGSSKAVASDGQLPAGQARIVIPVSGMTCGGCEAAIKVVVRKLDGVVDVQADYKNGSATVTYFKEKVTVEKIVEAINKTGFKATPPEQDKGR